MGLDMYAVRKVYVKQWDSVPVNERYSVQLTRGGKQVVGINPENINYIEEEVMYWRKANHIHAWFVANVQDGENDCKSYRVNWDKLRGLYSICEKVIKASKLVDGAVYNGTVYDKDHPNGVVQRTPGKVIEDATVAKELLPTQKGFFFGSYEYDEDYLNDVEETHSWAGLMLDDHIMNGVPGDIYYSSSW